MSSGVSRAIAIHSDLTRVPSPIVKSKYIVLSDAFQVPATPGGNQSCRDLMSVDLSWSAVFRTNRNRDLRTPSAFGCWSWVIHLNNSCKQHTDLPPPTGPANRRTYAGSSMNLPIVGVATNLVSTKIFLDGDRLDPDFGGAVHN